MLVPQGKLPNPNPRSKCLCIHCLTSLERKQNVRKQADIWVTAQANSSRLYRPPPSEVGEVNSTQQQYLAGTLLAGRYHNDHITFLRLSSSAYFSAFFTMFSISSLLRPPEDWITTALEKKH